MRDHDRVFEESFTRVIGPGPLVSEKGQQFFDEFYQRFLSKSSAVEEIFRDTDMSHQARMLLKSVHHLAGLHVTGAVSDYLVDIARRHSAIDLDVPPELYDYWIEALIETVEATDPSFDESVALAWRLAMAPGIAVMQHYAALHRIKTEDACDTASKPSD